LKRVFVSFYPYWKEYNERAHTLKNADWLIYGGAGEVGDNILFLRQIVELRVAQKLGINTAALNQSVVIKTDVFRKLVGHVYINMKKIVIRGTVTCGNLISYGVPAGIIEVAPYSAINARFHIKCIKKEKNLFGFKFFSENKNFYRTNWHHHPSPAIIGKESDFYH
jgi:hypothetical protein